MLPKPIVIIIRKKKMHQIQGKGMRASASGYTMKLRPGPPTAKSFTSIPVLSDM
jgi:hypothetical protein